MNLISDGSAALLLATALLVSLVGPRVVPALLLAASGVFYLVSAPGGVLWLTVSVLATFVVGQRLPSMVMPWARWAVTVVVLLIVGALCVVKLPGKSVLAPLGISYFSFRLIAYVLDIYWGRTRPAGSLVGFASFVAFFPQITSGPIQRWDDFRHQIEEFRQPSLERLVSAMRLILFGLFKKIVVANRLGLVVDRVFEDPGAASPLLLVIAAYAFPIQLYADFSGLTDIARGASRLVGIEAPQNFDRPFLASSVQEFWSRWHISLTSWLRDYLFNPLVVALRRLGRTGLALAISANMVAIGVWHGLKWTFLVFGVLNAIYLVVPVLLRRSGRKGFAVSTKGPRRWAGVVMTFHLMMLAFVFFRANDLMSAVRVLNGFAQLPLAWRQAMEVPWSFSVTRV